MSMIFISHAVADDEMANRISEALQNAGVETWVDHRDIQPGQRWIPSIRRALDQCSAGLLVLSQDSSKSRYNTEECLYILSADKPVYLVAVEPVSPLDVDARLRSLERVDVYEDFAGNMGHLIDSLKSDTQPAHPHSVNPVRVTIEISGDADEIETRVRKLLGEMSNVDGDQVRVTRSGIG
jgi:hypothetical protein